MSKNIVPTNTDKPMNTHYNKSTRSVNMQLELSEKSGVNTTSGFKIIHTKISGAGEPFVDLTGVPEENLVNATKRELALLHDLSMLTIK